MNILDSKERIKKYISKFADQYNLVKTHRKDYNKGSEEQISKIQ